MVMVVVFMVVVVDRPLHHSSIQLTIIQQNNIFLFFVIFVL